MIWQTKKLGELFEITSSKRVFKSDWTEKGVPFYRAREIVSLAKKELFRSPIFVSEKMYEKYKSKYGVPEQGDILVTGVGTLGVCYIVKKDDKFYFKDGNIIWLKKNSDVDSQYVEHFFHSAVLKKQIESNAGGATVKTFTIKTAKAIKIPFPPLHEQKKIVAKIERSFAKIDEVARLRAAADVDTAKIMRAALDEVFERGKKQGWEEKKLDDIFEINRGGSPRPIKSYITDAADGINWIKIGDSQKGSKYITTTSQKITSAGLKKTRLVKSGDLIISNSMSFGHPYIMKTDGAIHDGWLLLRSKIKDINLDYVYYVLGSDDFYRQFENAASGAVVKNLNTTLVSRVKIPVPPFEKQNRIAQELDSLSEKVRILRQLQEEVGQELKELKKAVLEEVFR